MAACRLSHGLVCMRPTVTTALHNGQPSTACFMALFQASESGISLTLQSFCRSCESIP